MLSALAALALATCASPARAAAPDSTATADTLGHVVPLAPVEVSTTRTGANAPFARSVVTREELRTLNTGQDTPMALATMPGAYAYSDAGNGVGYSYLSLRGFPQRRISVLINGVPLNDPESHEVYWIDHPDLLASTSQVEVQRGVGSALYGAASVGGSVNVETGPMSETPSATLLGAVGTFGSTRTMFEGSSGRTASGWNFYGRYSRIESGGYRDQSATRLWSYALSARRDFGRQSARVNLYGGPEETHLAYLGIPAEFMDGQVTGSADRDRKFNPLTYPGERDHFFEPHYELIHSWSPSDRVLFTQTLFYFDGRGYYDEQRLAQNLGDYRLATWTTADSTLAPHDYYAQDTTGALTVDGSGKYTLIKTDVVRRRQIVDRHYGWVPRVRLEHEGGALTLGGELRAHDGHHTGEVLSGGSLPPGTPPDLSYYDYHPRTLAAGLFAREQRKLKHDLEATLDLAWRHQGYDMRDDQFDHIAFKQTYDFVIPRVALGWTPRQDWNVFGAWAYSSREPAFRDLYDGEGPGNVPLFADADVVTNSYGDPLIKPEHVNDFELGGAWKGGSLSANLNLFYMNFRDELVYNGQFNTDLGYPVLGNAAQSVHQGVELALATDRPVGGGMHALLGANATLSDNHFVRYREKGSTGADTLTYDGKQIALFPAAMANLSAGVRRGGAMIGAELQYASRIYVDNTESVVNSVGPHAIFALSGSWRVALRGTTKLELSARVNNLLDNRYATSGYMDYDASGNLVPQFMPAATRTVTGQVRLDF
jgi:iron complex outermembrane receptor protein